MREIAAALITLHTASGVPIEVNPSYITHMRNPEPGPGGKNFTPGAKCLINMIDGRFIAVVETCDSVKDKLK